MWLSSPKDNKRKTLTAHSAPGKEPSGTEVAGATGLFRRLQSMETATRKDTGVVEGDMAVTL